VGYIIEPYLPTASFPLIFTFLGTPRLLSWPRRILFDRKNDRWSLSLLLSTRTNTYILCVCVCVCVLELVLNGPIPEVLPFRGGGYSAAIRVAYTTPYKCLGIVYYII